MKVYFADTAALCILTAIISGFAKTKATADYTRLSDGRYYEHSPRYLAYMAKYMLPFLPEYLENGTYPDRFSAEEVADYSQFVAIGDPNVYLEGYALGWFSGMEMPHNNSTNNEDKLIAVKTNKKSGINYNYNTTQIRGSDDKSIHLNNTLEVGNDFGFLTFQNITTSDVWNRTFEYGGVELSVNYTQTIDGDPYLSTKTEDITKPIGLNLMINRDLDVDVTVDEENVFWKAFGWPKKS